MHVYTMTKSVNCIMLIDIKGDTRENAKKLLGNNGRLCRGDLWTKNCFHLLEAHKLRGIPGIVCWKVVGWSEWCIRGRCYPLSPHVSAVSCQDDLCKLRIHALQILRQRKTRVSRSTPFIVTNLLFLQLFSIPRENPEKSAVIALTLGRKLILPAGGCQMNLLNKFSDQLFLVDFLHSSFYCRFCWQI